MISFPGVSGGKCIHVCNYWPPVNFLAGTSGKIKSYKSGVNPCCEHDTEPGNPVTGLCVPSDPFVGIHNLNERCDPGWVYSTGVCFNWQRGTKQEVKDWCIVNSGGRLLGESDLDPLTQRQFLSDVIWTVGTVDAYRHFSISWLWLTEECVADFDGNIIGGVSEEYHQKCTWNKRCPRVRLGDLLSVKPKVKAEDCDEDRVKPGGTLEAVHLGLCLLNPTAD